MFSLPGTLKKKSEKSGNFQSIFFLQNLNKHPEHTFIIEIIMEDFIGYFNIN